MDAGGVGSSTLTSTLTSSSVSASSEEHPATSRARFDWCFGMSEDHREPGKNGWSWVRIPVAKFVSNKRWALRLFGNRTIAECSLMQKL